MKQKKSIIWLILSVLLIVLLANPGILPLSQASKESLRELEKTHLLIPGSGKVLIRFRHIDHVMGNPLHLLRRGPGGADGHVTVDLHGVGGDHLPVQGLGQGDA